MGYTTHQLKIPDDKSWVALVGVAPDGSSTIIGYIDLTEFKQLAILSGKLFYLWQNYLNA